MIEVRDAKKWIQNGARRVEILKGITLTIPAGQFVAILGASGSGKSTLLGLLAGLDTPSSGEITLLRFTMLWVENCIHSPYLIMPIC